MLPIPSARDFRAALTGEYHSMSLVAMQSQRGNFTVSRLQEAPHLIVLETRPIPEKLVDLREDGFRFVIDPENGFRLLRRDHFRTVQNEDRIFDRMTVDEFREIGNGVMVPVRFTTTSFDYEDKSTYGAPYSETTVRVDLFHSQWNRVISRGTFDVPLPAGTSVSDSIRKVSFVTGKPDPGKNIDDLLKSTDHAIQWTPNTDRPRMSYWQRTRLWWIFGSITAIAFSFGVVFVVRWFRRSPRGEQ